MKLDWNPLIDGMSGIYIIEVLPTGRFYIGQAADIKRRFNEHNSALNSRKHFNAILQRSWNKYGDESLVMRMLQPSMEEDLDRLEQSWVDAFWDNGKKCCNLKKEVNKPPVRRGAKLTPDQLKKWSEVKLGKKHSEIHKLRIGLSKLGKKRKPFSKEWLEKLRVGRFKTYDIKLKSPDGKVYGPIHGLKDFCKEHGIRDTSIYALLKGIIKQTQGWTLIENNMAKHNELPDKDFA